jgi:hypothetical protein
VVSSGTARGRGLLLNRIIVALACALTFLAIVPAAPGAIRITRVYFDSPGSDYGSNSSLNHEWIRLRNTGSRARSLTGWKIRDTGGHVYRFGQFRLRAGRSVTVHTGSGSNTGRHHYWGQGWYVWNNDGDTARLRKRNGTLVDTCSFSGTGSSTAC